MSNNTPDKHFRYMDSARGIAALMVCVMHFYEHKYIGRPINDYLSILFNGRDAVSFFFVLSGFVLSYKHIVLNKPLDIKQFYVSRFFRLWPAFFIILIVDCVYAFYYNGSLTPHKLSDIFISNNDGFWEEAYLIKFHNNYYGPGWTLTIEMCASFLLPFYILIAKKNKLLIPLLIGIFYVALDENFYFSIHFLLGILIACYYTQINVTTFKEKKWFKFRYLIILFAIAIWPIRYYQKLSHFGWTYLYLEDFLNINAFHYTAISSAVFLVIMIYNKRVQKFLQNKVLVYMGTLSYAIYLVHPFCISMIYNVLEKNIPTKNPNIVVTSMIIGYMIITVLLAMVLHYGVERPFMKIGKRVISKMKPSIIIVDPAEEVA